MVEEEDGLAGREVEIRAGVAVDGHVAVGVQAVEADRVVARVLQLRLPGANVGLVVWVEEEVGDLGVGGPFLADFVGDVAVYAAGLVAEKVANGDVFVGVDGCDGRDVCDEAGVGTSFYAAACRYSEMKRLVCFHD